MKRISILFLFVFCINAVFSQATFEGSPRAICVGGSVTFTVDKSGEDGTITSYTWDFGDGQTSNEANPIHQYNDVGVFSISLTYEVDGSNEVASRTNHITVHALPQPSFNIEPFSCELPFSPEISDVSPTGGQYSYSWNFGNGQTSTNQTPTNVSYTADGTYAVTLVVSEDHGNDVVCTSEPVTKNITVNDHYAEFSVSTTEVCVGENITFTNLSDASTTQWSWDFGNGATNTAQNPSYAYPAPGEYTVILTASSPNCSDTYTYPVKITVNPRPEVDFTVDKTEGCLSDGEFTVIFTNQSDAGTYEWDFGNGTSTNSDPSNTYTANDSYTVTLTVTDANGCTNTRTKTNYINVGDITTVFNSNKRDGCEELEVLFTSSSVSPDPDGDPIVSWNWTFTDEDGATSTASGNEVTETFPYGIYNVTLQVETQSGCTGELEASEYIEVGVQFDIDFTVLPTEDCAKSLFEFVAEANHDILVEDVDYEEADLDFAWDFGDGQTGNGKETEHFYPVEVDSMDVTLTVTYRGCDTALVKESYVNVLAPIASFNVTDGDIFCSPGDFPTGNPELLEVEFVTDATLVNEIDGSEDHEGTVYWWFGDDAGTPQDGDNTNFSVSFDYQTDNLIDDVENANTSHNYANYGTYTVYQMIENLFTGCVDTFDLDITISDAVVGFQMFEDDSYNDLLPNIICVGQEFYVRGDTSTAASAEGHYFRENSITYNFGDGSAPKTGQTNSFHTYNTPGNYQIIFSGATQDADGNPLCGHADTLELTVANPVTPVIDYNVLGDGLLCSPFDAEFSHSNSTSDDGYGLELFEWVFDVDGNEIEESTADISETFVQTISGAGNFTYTAKLIITNEFGCRDSITENITVTKPNPQFELDSIACNFDTITASNSSTGAGELSYQWFVNGDAVSTDTDLTTVIAHDVEEGQLSAEYDIRLVVTDFNGCINELTKTIVISLPKADFNYEFDAANFNAEGEATCPPVFSSFEDISETLGDTLFYSWDFGNGNFSTLQNPNNTYFIPGTYTGSLIVEDQFGCRDTVVYEDYLTIRGPYGEVSWEIVGDLCNPTYRFYPDTLTNVAEITWELGDGTVVSDTNSFEHVYDEIGSYNVVVTLFDNADCDVEVMDEIINVQATTPNASFTISQASADEEEFVTIVDNSTSGESGIPLVNWIWDTGVEQFENNGASFDYAWEEAGIYSVFLTVVDTNNCIDTVSVEILIKPEVVVPNIFTPNGDNANDVFMLHYDAFLEFDLVIVNRWGNVVREAQGLTGVDLWTGTNLKGNPCTDGVYFYKIDGILLDGEPYSTSGYVTLINGKN